MILGGLCDCLDPPVDIIIYTAPTIRRTMTDPARCTTAIIDFGGWLSVSADKQIPCGQSATTTTSPTATHIHSRHSSSHDSDRDDSSGNFMGERGDILNGHCDDAMLRVKRRRDTACFGNRNVCTRLRGERHGHGKDLRVEGGSLQCIGNGAWTC